MIKKIHYCWFGGKKLPKDVKKCIATWEKMLPDYEIIEWNEEKFDVNSVPFVKQAYDNKKWAFVSDYVRTYALYEQGGLYLDTDVKILKNVEDIIDKNLVFGYEDSGYFGTAVIATNITHNPYIKEILEYYSNIEDFNVDIIYNYANPAIITRIINKYPVELQKNGVKIFNKNVTVYPRDYFYPLSYNYSEKVYTKNTCMVHLFNGTWTDKGERRTIGLYRKFGLGLGGTLNKIIDSIFSIKSRIKNIIYGIYKFFRMKYSIYINRNKRVKNIEEQIKRLNSDYIVICDPDVREVKEKVEDNFERNIIEIRQQHTKKEAQMIAEKICDSKVKMVVFNDYSRGWDQIIKTIKSINKDITIKNVIYYGNSYFSDAFYWENNNNLLDLYFKGMIDEFGVYNKTLHEFYLSKGYKCSLLYNKIKIENKEKNPKNSSGKSAIKIGMYYTGDKTENNIYNQLAAVSMIENSKLDCIPLNYKISGIAKKMNITLSGNSMMPSNIELEKQMEKNDVNLYITLINKDSMIPIQSLEQGVPCLISRMNNVFNNKKLEKYLLVENPEDIIGIHNKILNAIENRKVVLNEYAEWKKQYSNNALEKIRNFLKD